MQKPPVNAKKANADRLMDRQTDGPTQRVIESRSTLLKREPSFKDCLYQILPIVGSVLIPLSILSICLQLSLSVCGMWQCLLFESVSVFLSVYFSLVVLHWKQVDNPLRARDSMTHSVRLSVDLSVCLSVTSSVLVSQSLSLLVIQSLSLFVSWSQQPHATVMCCSCFMTCKSYLFTSPTGQQSGDLSYLYLHDSGTSAAG